MDAVILCLGGGGGGGGSDSISGEIIESQGAGSFKC